MKDFLELILEEFESGMDCLIEAFEEPDEFIDSFPRWVALIITYPVFMFGVLASLIIWPILKLLKK